jgi:hypothetical protein
VEASEGNFIEGIFKSIVKKATDFPTAFFTIAPLVEEEKEALIPHSHPFV